MTTGLRDVTDFADEYRAAAARWDAEQRLPERVLDAIAEAGYLGAVVPVEYGGAGADMSRFGELCAALGGTCTSVRSLITVQSMVADVILRWGSTEQRQKWLPELAKGSVIAGLAATEPDAGSDLGGVQAAVREAPGGYLISGVKQWVTFGAVAGLYLVLGQLGGKPTAVLVERDAHGVRIELIRGQLGLRAAMLGHIRFEDTPVPAGNLVARPGFGLSHVVGGALDHGRYSVAWGCAGMVQRCVELSARYATGRVQGGGQLAEHQLIRELITNMMVEARSSRLLCEDAARLVAAGGPDTSTMIMMAKYQAGRAATRVAGDAVQVHGSAGCAAGSAVERFYRDAKIMQIIEGSDQVSQLTICESAFRKYRHRPGV
ncbi:MAG: acyl-CoA dehydrogenase family protein [Pseudonocardiaceae bacterium]